MNSRRPLFSSSQPRVLGAALLSTALLTGCTKKPDPEEDAKAEPAADGADAKADDAKGANAAGATAAAGSTNTPAATAAQDPAAGALAATLIKAPVREAQEDVLGHISMPSIDRMLESVSTHFATPQISPFLNWSMIRSFAGPQLGDRRALLDNLDTSKPMGCAIIDVKTYKDGPVACTFGYKGGAAAMIKDLGATGQKPNAGSHTAVYTIEGKDVYIDALKDAVVITLYDDVFTKTSGYVQRNIIDRAPTIAGTFEAVAWINHAYGRYKTEIDDLFKMAQSLSNSAPPPDTGDPDLDNFIKSFQASSDDMSRKNLERIADYEHGAMQFGGGANSVWIDFDFKALPGTQAAKDSAQYGGHVVDRAVIEKTPSGAIALMGWSADLQAVNSPVAVEARAIFTQAWAAVTGNDAAAAEAAVRAEMEKMAATYTGDGAMALVHEPGAVAGVYFTQKLKVASAREDFRAWTQKFTPEAILGAKAAKYVTWSFQMDAGSAGGVPIDRWVIEPTPEGLAKMNIDAEKKPEIDKWVGGVKLTIDRTEAGGQVIWTMAPKREDAFATRAVQAAKGTGSITGDPGLAQILSIYPDSAAIGGVDVRQGMEWLRSFPTVAEEMKEVPPGVGVNLADLHFAAAYRKDGTNDARIGVAQSLVDQMRALAGK